MALNSVFKTGDKISLPVPTGTLAGAPLRIGSINCIAVTDEGSVTVTKQLGGGTTLTENTGGVGNEPGYASVACDGAWNVDVTGALTVGQLVYINGSNSLTATATGNKVWGKALRAKGSGSGKVVVRIVDTDSDAAA